MLSGLCRILVHLIRWALNNISVLYPTARKASRKSFIGVKRQTVPNQSMSLAEIVRRFIRREPLPVSHEGFYESRFGDLEKLSKADIVEQMSKVDELKAHIKAFKERQKKAVPVQSSEGVGVTPDQKSPPQGA